MFGVGMQELIFVLLIALIVLGPKKLPEIARAVGRGVRELRRHLDEGIEGRDAVAQARGKRDPDPDSEAKGTP